MVYFLLFLFLLILRLTLRSRMRRKRQSRFNFANPSWVGRSAGSPPAGAPGSRAVDEMKPCAHCGTYVPARLSWRKNNLYFCGERCQEGYSRQKA